MILGAAAGFFSGIISGMGIGGGAILIPVLTFMLDMGQREAQFVNLVYFVPTAAAALVKHKKEGNIERNVLKPLIIFGIFGSVVGAAFASRASDGILKTAFGIFLGIMGIYEIIKGYNEKTDTKKD